MKEASIKELFAKRIDRSIDGVIKADDERHINIELEEYVFTREVIKGLNIFVDAYLNDPNSNGIWISGFFGSGKSHLLKILSLILDHERKVDDKSPYEILLPKIEDELLRADFKKAISIPSKSLLFNIAQKYDGIGGDHNSPVLEVFMKVLNEMQGYYGNQGYIAELEYGLNKRNQFISFQKTYEDLNQRSWISDREAVATVTKRNFAKAYAAHFGGNEEEGIKALNDAKDDYRLSIEGFAERVEEYLDEKGPNFRLNFFVDEVGLFIGQERIRLLDLQTIVESLATITEGRASVFITSQADLEGVLGQVKVEQADDLSKIQGRFKTKLSLASADVKEVIQARLLNKNPVEPEQLIKIYETEKDNFLALYRFGDNSIQLKGWQNCQDFCGLYPFHPYQMSLFQQAIQSLAAHSIFEGRNMSVGERPMLSVFQDVAKNIKEERVGRFASFDELYDGISKDIRSDKKQTITSAQNQLNNFELRILKALFLLKWVSQFKCTARNISILLINQTNCEIKKHEQKVNDALINLEQQSYLQRNGDIYEFLTDKEKDIEQEIKLVEISESEVTKQLHNIIFENVLKSTGKIRFEDNNNDYPISHKIDSGLFKGKETNISLNLITPENANYQNKEILIARNMGAAELMIILPDENLLLDQIRIHLKTEIYIKQNSGGEDDLFESILASRFRQNTIRRQDIQILASEMLQNSQLIINGQTFKFVEGEIKNRFHKAYQDLIRSAYPKLSMIRSTFNMESLYKVLEDQDNLIEDSSIQLSEAENEIMIEIFRIKDNGVRISTEFLINKFGNRPYGWSNWATLTLIAHLYSLNKLELREKELLGDNEIIEALSDSKRWSGVTIRKQDIFDPKQINELKLFHQNLFGTLNNGHDARSTCETFRLKMAEEIETIKELVSQESSYPFLSSLKPWLITAEELQLKNNNYLLKELNAFKDELLNSEKELLTPLKQFMLGVQRSVYDKVRNFFNENKSELNTFTQAEKEPIQNLLKSNTPYSGGLLPKAKSSITTLEIKILDILTKSKEKAQKTLDKLEQLIRLDTEFQKLSIEEKERIMSITLKAKKDISESIKPGAVLLRLKQYCDEEKPNQIQEIARLSQNSSGSINITKSIKVIPSSSLKPDCNLSQISNTNDLDEWLESLRSAAKTELENGNRISL